MTTTDPSIEDVLAEHADWSRRMFAGATWREQITKLAEEIAELATATTDAERAAEAADVVLAVQTMCALFGLDLERAVGRKAREVWQRRYGRDETGMWTRDRTADEEIPSKSDVATPFHITIDRTEYAVHRAEMSGAELRLLPPTRIGPDRDLFKVVPGRPDRKIETSTRVEISDGGRFFTAPARINPGRGVSMSDMEAAMASVGAALRGGRRSDDEGTAGPNPNAVSAEFMAALECRVTARVRALHHPIGNAGQWCAECSGTTWPCPTIQVFSGEGGTDGC